MIHSSVSQNYRDKPKMNIPPDPPRQTGIWNFSLGQGSHDLSGWKAILSSTFNALYILPNCSFLRTSAASAVTGRVVLTVERREKESSLNEIAAAV